MKSKKVMLNMLKRRGIIKTFTRLFINTTFFYVVMNSLTIVIQIIGNKYFNKNYLIDYSTVSLTYILLIPLTLSILLLGNNKYITKAVRIDEKATDENRIKDAIEDLKWHLKEQTEDSLTFVSPLGLGVFREEINVSFSDMEIYITGPGRYVEDMIRLAKFPYASFEIIANE